MTRIAIVTGASSGLGWHFARELDRQIELDEIWLIARRRERLEELAGELAHAKGVVLPMDLTGGGAEEKLRDRLAETGDARVRYCVNNAGYGKVGRFERSELGAQLGMIDLNVRALTAVTAVALPHMQSGDGLVQVASSAGFVAMPALAVYAATKAYVVSFTYALRAELKDRGIHATAVCPGPVRTEFQEVAGVDIGDAPSPITAEPVDVVRRALADVDRNKALSIYGPAMQAFHKLSNVLPRAAFPTLSKYL